MRFRPALIMTSVSASPAGACQAETRIAAGTGTSRVVRTVFDGAKRAVALGSLSNVHIVQIPARSIVTVALSP
jgi:hypothetical protein